MKAIIFPTYGSPDVLQLQEVPQPMPKEDEVLVKVVAAAANPLDWHRLRADPFIVRLGDGFWRPKNPKLGADMAGQVAAVGSRVTEFQIGDEVFGDVGSGGFAEYVCAKEKALAHKPANLSFAQAAAVPVAGFTALQGLRDKGQIKQGQKVLVNGASGGVGTFAVQIAKAWGAEVTAVCSGRNLDLVRSIGADHAIDYTQTDFTRTGQQYDLIYDAIGNRSVRDLRRALKPNGIASVAGFTTLSRMLLLAVQGTWVSKTSDKEIGMMSTANPNKKDLLVLKELLETGKVVPVLDKHYPLAETAEAIRYLESGRARGKVIINIER
ncbi:MAG: NAD(P)-dependent alcohol dehydrogenase [Chloroflexi bacterium]|nr:NAD(P)-dependent alcohol dehydrogenase [Chloroflexota bacterium]